MTDLVLLMLGFVAAVVIIVGTELVCRRTHLTDDGTPFDRLLSGERREYRDAP